MLISLLQSWRKITKMKETIMSKLSSTAGLLRGDLSCATNPASMPIISEEEKQRIKQEQKIALKNAIEANNFAYAKTFSQQASQSVKHQQNHQHNYQSQPRTLRR